MNRDDRKALAKADAKEAKRRQDRKDLDKLARMSDDRRRERNLALDRAADKRDRAAEMITVLALSTLAVLIVITLLVMADVRDASMRRVGRRL